MERVSRNNMAKLNSFQGNSAQSTFIYVVINNLIKDFFKTKKVVISYDDSLINIYSTQDEDKLIKELDEERVINAINSLNIEEQLLIKLKYYDEYSIKDISYLMNKTPKQLSKKIETIKKKLRRILNRDDFYL